MKTILRSNKSVKLIKSSFMMLASAALTFSAVNSAHAEDIEIYDNLINNALVGTDTVNRPNILFVLDTSRSMRARVAVSSPRPPYDPGTDYGDSPDDNIYIYEPNDEGPRYTEAFVEDSQNSCSAATQYFADNPNNPDFFNRSILWLQQDPVEEVVCNTTPTVTTTTYSQTFSRERFRANIQNVPLNPGDEIRLTYSSNGDRSAPIPRFRFTRNGNTVRQIIACNQSGSDNARDDDFVEDGDTRSCENGNVITVPNGDNVVLQLRVRAQDGRGNTISYTPTLSYTVIRSQLDTSTCSPVEGVAGSGVWQEGGDADFFLDNPEELERIAALECQADFGNDGINDTSLEVYPQQQEAGRTIFTPNYSADFNADQTSIIDYESIADSLLVPGNYHDYLQTPTEQLFDTASITFDPVSDFGTGASLSETEWCNHEFFRLTQNLFTGAVFRTINDSGFPFFEFDPFGYLNDRRRDDALVSVNDEIFQCRTRMGILKRVTNDLVNTLDDVNIGLMRFNSEEGGSLVQGIKNISGGATAGANRDEFIRELLALPAFGATPLQEAFYESYNYFAGNEVETNLEEKSEANDPNNQFDLPSGAPAGTNPAPLGIDESTTDDLTDTTVVTNAGGALRFVSPIINQCQDNNIILFSDGEPSDGIDESFASDIINFRGTSVPDGVDLGTCGTDAGDCLDDLAYGLANNDVNTNVDGINKVFTYTVGFGDGLDENAAGETFLDAVGNAGRRNDAELGSHSFSANSPEALRNAFRSILQNIGNVTDESFVAPAVTVNTFNRITNREELYFALFQPNNSPRWNGNIKKYGINSDAEITDRDGNNAIDEDTGFFTETSQSFWSDEVDGPNVTLGGLAGELDRLPRTMFANLDETAVGNGAVVQLFRDDALSTLADPDGNSATDDRISLGAVGATEALLNENRQDIIDFTFGLDVETSTVDTLVPNFYVAESLHSTPVVISYGTTEAQPDDVVFAVTNQGLLHAIKGESDIDTGGEELWTYVPDPDLFSNFGDYFRDDANAEHSYGLDSAVVAVVERDSQNNLTQSDLYFGQRRGGNKYFGISVLNAMTAVSREPATTTVIPPDAGTSSNPVRKLWTFNTERLGQTWAPPVPAVINYCDAPRSNVASAPTPAAPICGPRDVLVLAGGYDEAYDGSIMRDSNGEIVRDAETGAPLLTNADLEDIAQQDIKGNVIYIIDVNDEDGDGLPDQMGADGQPRVLWAAGKENQLDDSNERNFVSPEMVHSFPSAPTVLDADFDGVADLMFISDIAGRIWRFDFRGNVTVDNNVVTFDDNDIYSGNNTNEVEGESGSISANANNEVSGGIIADLSETGVNRRFYNSLDVSFSPRTEDDFARYNIVLGSGYRAHPLVDEFPNSTNREDNNRIYVVFDRNLTGPQPVFNSSDEPTGEITYNYDDSGVGQERVEADDINALGNSGIDPSSTHRYGFFVTLVDDSTEKVINPTITNSFQILAVSYTPTRAVVNQANNAICQQNIGSSRLYQIDLLTGDVLSVQLARPGISPEASVVVVPGDDGPKEVVVVGTEPFDTGERNDGSTLEEDGKIDIGGDEPGVIETLNWWEVQANN